MVNQSKDAILSCRSTNTTGDPRFAQPEFMQVGHGSGTFRVKQIPWLRGEGDEVALDLNPAGRLYEPK